ncbi:hypothetical protein GCM10027567_22490 [Spongiibacter taiwanensis]
MEELLENGEEFSTTTIDRLSETAGISRATFYLNYKDKADLVTHLFEQVRIEIIESAGDWFINAANTTYHDIRNTLKGILSTYRNHYVVLSALHQTAQTNSEVAKLSRDMRESLSHSSVKAAEQLKAAGRGNPLAGPMVASLLTLAIDSVSTLQPELLTDEKLDETCDAWAHITWSALAGKEFQR